QQTRGKGSGRPLKKPGWSRGCEPARQAPCARAPAGRMEEGRRGGEVPGSRAAVRPVADPTPARARDPPSPGASRAFR
ncbi:hypothetical protein P7K49_006669, partial [Saguinus oedipus]